MFQIYKPGQAKMIRLLLAFLVQVFIIYGCYQLYLWMNFTDVRGNPRWIAKQFSYSEGLEIEVAPRLLIALGLFLLFSLSNFLLCNGEKFSNFLIDVHTELSKVSWPTREEVIKSSAVVLVVTGILMFYIAILDYGFSWIVSLILGTPAS